MLLTGVDDEEPWHSRSDRRAVGGAGAADRRGPAALQGAARQPAGDDRGHPLLSRSKRPETTMLMQMTPPIGCTKATLRPDRLQSRNCLCREEAGDKLGSGG